MSVGAVNSWLSSTPTPTWDFPPVAPVRRGEPHVSHSADTAFVRGAFTPSVDTICRAPLNFDIMPCPRAVQPTISESERKALSALIAHKRFCTAHVLRFFPGLLKT